jgi:TM2 domain-containing membrane protein YozV
VTAACPYCLTEIEPDAADALYCGECGTPTHRECWEENGGCTVFGCPQAPSDEEKVTIGAGDLERAEASASTPSLQTWGDLAVAPPPVIGSPPAPPFPEPAVPPPPFPDGYVPPAPTRPTVKARPVSLNGSLSITAPAYSQSAPVYGPAKSRVMFILLGIFFGMFGAHNFYAGYHKRGAGQLALTCISFFTLAVVTWIWAIVEVCVVAGDSDSVPMQ